MVQQLMTYIMSLVPQIGLTEQELRLSLEWLKKNYQVWFNACKDYGMREILYETLLKDPDNWVATISYCDICYEYGDMKHIERLLNDRRFPVLNSVKIYLLYRNEFKASGNEDCMWQGYLLGVTDMNNAIKRRKGK